VPIGLALGAALSCALLSDLTVKCWGSNASGQIGVGDASDDAMVLVPTLVPGLDHVAAIFSGPAASHTLALLQDGGLMCWGHNPSNEHECNGVAGDPAPPTQLTGISGVARAAAGDSYSCAALADAGGVVCWGWWWNGASTQSVSIIDHAPASATSLAAGTKYTCASAADGTYGCWGDNSDGTGFPLMDASASTSAVPPYSVGAVTALAAAADGHEFACVAITDGGVTCWGNDDVGETTGSDTNALSAQHVDNVTNAASVTAGNDSACARQQDGTVKCWGGNHSGESGQTANDILIPPSKVALGGSASVLAQGAIHACAIVDAGVVQCWGDNTYGQLGNGKSVAQPTYTIETVKF
jgi:alpha-tubulin suppressor-like RCC1 family protein